MAIKMRTVVSWVGPVLIVLGVAHMAAMPWVANRFDSLASFQFRLFVLMFQATGAAVVLCGLLHWTCRNAPRSGYITSILLLSALYVLLLGVAAVYVAPLNPLAYVLTLAGLFATWAAFRKPVVAPANVKAGDSEAPEDPSS